MKNSTKMLLMAALIGINTGVAMGTEIAEKYAFTRTVCKEMMNMYAYNKQNINRNDLQLFIEYKSIASSDELINVLEHGKTLLNYDILGIKTENKSAKSYWAALLAAPVVWFGGLQGFVYEMYKNRSFEQDLRGHYWRKWDATKQCYPEYMENGQFNVAKFEFLNAKPVGDDAYIIKVSMYRALMAAGLIAIPVVANKLYNHYMNTRNKQKEIATLDAIIEQIKLIQQAEMQ